MAGHLVKHIELDAILEKNPFTVQKHMWEGELPPVDPKLMPGCCSRVWSRVDQYSWWKWILLVLGTAGMIIALVVIMDLMNDDLWVATTCYTYSERWSSNHSIVFDGTNHPSPSECVILTTIDLGFHKPLLACDPSATYSPTASPAVPDANSTQGAVTLNNTLTSGFYDGDVSGTGDNLTITPHACGGAIEHLDGINATDNFTCYFQNASLPENMTECHKVRYHFVDKDGPLMRTPDEIEGILIAVGSGLTLCGLLGAWRIYAKFDHIPRRRTIPF